MPNLLLLLDILYNLLNKGPNFLFFFSFSFIWEYWGFELGLSLARQGL
jgi:hypothetical protein